jgi:hypothetical protein
MACLITRDDFRQVTLAENFVTNGAWISVVELVEATRVCLPQPAG